MGKGERVGGGMMLRININILEEEKHNRVIKFSKMVFKGSSLKKY